MKIVYLTDNTCVMVMLQFAWAKPIFLATHIYMHSHIAHTSKIDREKGGGMQEIHIQE